MDSVPRTTYDTSAIPAGGQAGIAIRPLASLAEFQACVRVQHAVWGAGFSEGVPVSLLQAATYIGGLAIGAFSDQDELLGFVFGLTGVVEGRAAHWSHLLGVVDAARNLGLGRMLKEYQRTELARRGIPEMLWTFDPLVAKNAHLNLNVLGARAVRYSADLYGTTSTPLHHGLPTDRLVVACTTGVRDDDDRILLGADEAPVLTLEPQAGDDLMEMRAGGPSRIRLEIPTDFQTLMSRSPARAAAWHTAVRAHFLWAFGAGYTVSGLHRDALSSRSFYVLTMSPARV